MRAVMCVDVEPNERRPGRVDGDTWSGADAMLVDDGWLRRRLSTPVINWFVRIDDQIEVMHGCATWAVDHFAERFRCLSAGGDEVGVHPHNWRLVDGVYRTDGSEEWMVHNASVALAGYEQVLGAAPLSFRYGDRFLSEAVTRLLIEHSGVRVDLTAEPGAAACRSLVAEDFGCGHVRNLDSTLSRRYRPSKVSVEIDDETGTLTAVPLTTGVVPGSGTIDTLQLWMPPDEFRPMASLRAIDSDIGHLAFAIRSDVQLLMDARQNVERNLDTVHEVFGDLVWVRASELALDEGEPAPYGLGITGSLAHEVEAAGAREHLLTQRLAGAELDLQELTVELEASSVRAEILARELADSTIRAERAEQSVAELTAQRSAVEATVLWRLRQRLLPVLAPLARCRRRFGGRA